MGDRSGLPKIDRTNGFEDGRDYMRVKNSKLAQQNDELRKAVRNRSVKTKSDLFKGISINVNGRTKPTANELKWLILLNGGDYHPYYRYQTTNFIIATNLSTARLKTLRPDDRVVKPEWITDSVEAKSLLPYENYQLFLDEPRGKDTVRPIYRLTRQGIGDPSTSKQQNELTSIVESYSSSYRKTTKIKSSRESSKPRDIRDLFSKCVRSIDKRGASPSTNKSNLKVLNNQSTIECDSDAGGSSAKQTNSQQESNEESNQSTISGNSNRNADKTSRSSNSQGKSTAAKKRPLTMSDFVIKGAKPNKFPAPKVTQKKTIANICGLSDLDQIITLLNEWVGCPEGVKDDDTACVTKFFFDLMGEKNYHNKLYEIIDAFKQRIIQHDEPIWINVYNNLIEGIKVELNQGSEASQNLYHLLNSVDIDSNTDRISNIDPQAPSLPTIPEIDID